MAKRQRLNRQSAKATRRRPTDVELRPVRPEIGPESPLDVRRDELGRRARGREALGRAFREGGKQESPERREARQTAGVAAAREDRIALGLETSGRSDLLDFISVPFDIGRGGLEETGAIVRRNLRTAPDSTKEPRSADPTLDAPEAGNPLAQALDVLTGENIRRDERRERVLIEQEEDVREELLAEERDAARRRDISASRQAGAIRSSARLAQRFGTTARGTRVPADVTPREFRIGSRGIAKSLRLGGRGEDFLGL